jgi:hypothetical protein
VLPGPEGAEGADEKAVHAIVVVARRVQGGEGERLQIVWSERA